jgi:hypothetical protein
MSGCVSFGVFSQMVMAPQVVGDSVVVSYSDAGAVNFATVVLQCGSASGLSAPSGASQTTTNAHGGNTSVFLLQSSAACFPVPVPTPLPLPGASSSSPHAVSAGRIVGIVIGVCAGLFIAATLIINWRRNQMHAFATVKFWTIAPKMCLGGQPREASEAPLMAFAPPTIIQADKLMEEA